MSTDLPLPVVGADLHHEELAAVRAGRLGRVHSWELVTGVDGPGTRLTVFLSGCLLRCQYCQNPDTWHEHDGMPTTLDELVAKLRRYAPALRAAHGGVTLSGGEPLVQPAFTANVFRAARELGLHTALDTSGFLGAHATDALLDDTDLVLLDVKSGLPDTYRLVTGQEVAPTLAFGRRLADRGTAMWIRFVLVPGLTDAPENIDAVADAVAAWSTVQRVEVLPFHQLGRDKWTRLGIPYPLADTRPPTPEQTAAARDRFRARGLTVY
ncbi:pyruvate formate-lyase-activating protein [Modestobacter roseus]|uniref:Pyruvate formate-lyase-activating enzyme n=1 Tax=Modestobacter roseus TaxID=1181884 RepID=A0A562IXF5_9ACTN|nr:pyruvate formate-lyase-activating protein [Modestobacter roseus]MQA32749.1 pyruvate formate lyase-activating protein [Modestobacter roseus]TWH75741.1 pyruvate formate lyase activating enzyme [Modestobacter roseus]